MKLLPSYSLILSLLFTFSSVVCAQEYNAPPVNPTDLQTTQTTVVSDQPQTTTTTQVVPPAVVETKTSTIATTPVTTETTIQQTSPTIVQSTTPEVITEKTVTTADIAPLHGTTTLSPKDTLSLLKEGNGRFVSGSMKSRNLLADAAATAQSATPYAVVLNCMDSRSSPEMIFDQGIGEIFAIRIAGNIQNDDILGSMEFATKLSGAKLIAVIGHTNCGAIRGACQQEKLGFLTGLLQKLQPAVKRATKANGGNDCQNNTYIDEIAKENVLLVMKQIEARSPTIKKLIDEGKLGIVGGMQDLATGRVTFFDDNSIMPMETVTVAPTTHIDNVQPSGVKSETTKEGAR